MARRRRSRNHNPDRKGEERAKETICSPQIASLAPSGESAVVTGGLIISSQHRCRRNELNKGKAAVIFSVAQASTIYTSDDESVGSCSPCRPPPIPVIDLGD